MVCVQLMLYSRYITWCLFLEHVEHLSGIPLHVKGNVIRGFPDVSGSQFAKLLKQVGFASYTFLLSMLWYHTSL
jgi:hypothetical protein